MADSHWQNNINPLHAVVVATLEYSGHRGSKYLNWPRYSIGVTILIAYVRYRHPPYYTIGIALMSMTKHTFLPFYTFSAWLGRATCAAHTCCSLLYCANVALGWAACFNVATCFDTFSSLLFGDAMIPLLVSSISSVQKDVEIQC